jgi:hypothetical protein
MADPPRIFLAVPEDYSSLPEPERLTVALELARRLREALNTEAPRQPDG